MANAPEQNLSQGDTGKPVRQLQEALAQLKYLEQNQVDGVFGYRTADALRRFQESRELDADAVYGPDTREALQLALVPTLDSVPPAEKLAQDAGRAVQTAVGAVKGWSTTKKVAAGFGVVAALAALAVGASYLFGDGREAR
jgi:peptidoglycan hydrolase-like protein with peptidoglycan-binding domain